jgi:hypothetical protein
LIRIDVEPVGAAMDTPQFYLETHLENSLNELREMETLTAANVRVIQEDNLDLEDLERLERQTAKIAANMRAIQEDPNDLD